jgi:ketosteroid isomerase-like protein
MGAESTPREVFDLLLAGVTSDDRSHLHELYAEDAVVDVPFAGPEPVRLIGRDGLRRHFEAGPGNTVKIRASRVRVYEATDPEVVIAEFDYELTGPYGTAHAANVQVMRVRNGLIVESRDYHYHARLEAAFRA